MKPAYQGRACSVSETKNKIRKYGVAVGNGSSKRGRNQRVHLRIVFFLSLDERRFPYHIDGRVYYKLKQVHAVQSPTVTQLNINMKFNKWLCFLNVVNVCSSRQYFASYATSIPKVADRRRRLRLLWSHPPHHHPQHQQLLGYSSLRTSSTLMCQNRDDRGEINIINEPFPYQNPYLHRLPDLLLNLLLNLLPNHPCHRSPHLGLAHWNLVRLHQPTKKDSFLKIFVKCLL